LLNLYSGDRYLATLEPVSFAKLQKLQALLVLLLERLEQFDFEIGEYIAHDGAVLLSSILQLHTSSISLSDFASDYDLLQNLFTRNIIELNKFKPCEEARKPRPHLKTDPISERLKLKQSGDRYMDDLADLTTVLGDYDQALSVMHSLSQTQIDYFLFRLIERRRDPASLVTEENHEDFFKDLANNESMRNYISEAIFG